MAIDILTQDLIPVRRDGQIASVSFGGGGGGGGGSTFLSPCMASTCVGNTFYGNQVFYDGYLYVSGATGDFFYSDNGISGYKPDGSYIEIEPGSVQFYNSVGDLNYMANARFWSKGLNSSLNLTETGTTSNNIALLVNGTRSILGTIKNTPHSGPVIQQYSLGNGMRNIIGFQPYTGWTNGTVTMFTPVVFNTGLTISGGTIEFIDTVWDDINIGPLALGLGVSAPALVDWTPTGSGTVIKALEFTKNDIAYFQCQLPHGYKVGTNIYGHVHWTPRNYGAAQSGATVGWKINYTIAGINANFPAVATIDLSDACDGTNDKHQMTPDLSIGSGSTVSAIISGSITRTDTGTDDTWSETLSGRLPLLLGIDFHYEIDTVGSRERLSK